MNELLKIDWLPSGCNVGSYFVSEQDLDESAIESILGNKFKDPLISSESEEESINFNWDEIFQNAQNKAVKNLRFIPGLRGLPPFPKLSALTRDQQYQCLKVLCAKNPLILESEYMARPKKSDYKVFEEVQQTYAAEQKEFLEWAKHIWQTDHCIRALRPKPLVETVYNAELEIKAKEMMSFPRNYVMAAQIPLEIRNVKFDMLCEKQLIGVDISDLPTIKKHEPIKNLLSIMVPCTTPEPCTKHPCRFVLPNEASTTILPLTEVHKELAQYALDNGVEFIASEKALKCLMEVDRAWTINLSVCECFTEDGEKRNVLVLGGEMMPSKECAQTRTYRAFKHLLLHALVPNEEKAKFRYKAEARASNMPKRAKTPKQANAEVSSDEDEFNLFIADEEAQTDSNSDTEQMSKGELIAKVKSRTQKSKGKEKKKNEFYKCSCVDGLYERPAPRSFKKWRLKNLQTQEHYDVIIHCSHKVRDADGEVLLEPVPEYQIDLAITQLSEERKRSSALSLKLRNNVTLMISRIDGATGEMVVADVMDQERHTVVHGDQTSDIANTILAAVGQLRYLLPGHYLLRHDVSHGNNALLYAPGSGGGDTLSLDEALTAEVDESSIAKTPPKLEPTLLPWHKYRKILPCAFTPYPQQVAKSKKVPPKKRQPPAAFALEAEDGSSDNVKWHHKNNKTRGRKRKRKN